MKKRRVKNIILNYNDLTNLFASDHFFKINKEYYKKRKKFYFFYRVTLFSFKNKQSHINKIHAGKSLVQGVQMHARTHTKNSSCSLYRPGCLPFSQHLKQSLIFDPNTLCDYYQIVNRPYECPHLGPQSPNKLPTPSATWLPLSATIFHGHAQYNTSLHSSILYEPLVRPFYP